MRLLLSEPLPVGDGVRAGLDRRWPADLLCSDWWCSQTCKQHTARNYKSTDWQIDWLLLIVTDCYRLLLPTDCYRLTPTDWLLPTDCYRLTATDWLLPTDCYRLLLTDCYRLIVTDWLLPTRLLLTDWKLTLSKKLKYKLNKPLYIYISNWFYQ